MWSTVLQVSKGEVDNLCRKVERCKLSETMSLWLEESHLKPNQLARLAQRKDCCKIYAYQGASAVWQRKLKLNRRYCSRCDKRQPIATTSWHTFQLLVKGRNTWLCLGTLNIFAKQFKGPPSAVSTCCKACSQNLTLSRVILLWKTAKIL